MINELKVEHLKTGDIIRTFDKDVGMVINIEGITPTVIYKDGFDLVSDLIGDNDIQAVARPNEDYMLAPNNWEHVTLWNNTENIIYERNIGLMTTKELGKNDKLHARPVYFL